ncbi:hypothetical protein HanRHA438_Chr05g0208111 [Helianthus annuus]|nr:hypothetical protein HanIR_Chr05g0214211 [Helianthus annuus]KAJ0917625.1 hypothetical protein HanRHA438_Chr05g0208111 [Helianthus annuus]
MLPLTPFPPGFVSGETLSGSREQQQQQRRHHGGDGGDQTEKRHREKERVSW